MTMTRYELAGALCEAVQETRLRRIGEHAPPRRHGNALDDLSAEERGNWLDMADAVLALYERRRISMKLAALGADWERYGELVVEEDRNSMRRALVVELDMLLDEMRRECDW